MCEPPEVFSVDYIFNKGLLQTHGTKTLFYSLGDKVKAEPEEAEEAMPSEEIEELRKEVQDVKKVYSFSIHIAPVKWSEKSLWEKNVEQAVAKQMEEQAEKEVVKLPETIDGKKVRYILKSDEKSYALVYLVLVLIICLPVFWRMQQKKEQTLRREQLLLDHPAVVNQFMLLLGAGLSVRKVIERLVSEYEKKCQRGGKKRYVYEELGVAMRQMHDGVSETKAVECFGRRCLLQQYLRFCSLITQNMKKGAEGMLAILETEAMDSLERRKEHALQLGEKAGTRLLFPMMLMLLIVMGIIMVPAFRIHLKVFRCQRRNK